MTAGCSSSWLLFLLKPCFGHVPQCFCLFCSALGFTAPSSSLTTLIANLLPEIGSFIAPFGRRRPVVFAEPQFSVGERYVRSVAAEVGGEVRLLYSATLTSDIPTYVDMMRHNCQVLLEALR